ncbi:hypothetical protein T265_13125, partial [Opisthorchis viverrini]
KWQGLALPALTSVCFLLSDLVPFENLEHKGADGVKFSENSDSLHNSFHGCGLRELVFSPLSNRWLVIPERVFPRIFIRGIRLRCNLLRTRVRSARHGHGGQTILCCGNCGQPDRLVHMLQSCWITHDTRCARHNRVARELAKRPRRLGYTVLEELRAPTSTSFIKPDLIAVRDRRATVTDVSIVSEARGVAVWNEEKQKGICFPQSTKAVPRLGLPKVATQYHGQFVPDVRVLIMLARTAS